MKIHSSFERSRRTALVAATLAGTLFAGTAQAKVIVVPPVTITSLAHIYDVVVPLSHQRFADGVDFPCGSGGGSCTSSGFTAALQHGDTVQMRFEAPAGQRFRVTPDAVVPEALSVYAGWSASGDSSAPPFPTPTVTFENLTGPAPVQTQGQAYAGDAGNAVTVQWSGSVSGSFTFTALAVSFQVINSPPGSSATFGPVRGYAHFSFDVGGSGALGTPDHVSMTLEPTPPQCSNGIDDDGDGLVDFPADPGCASATDLDEHGPTLACDDGADNDGDGLVDFKAGGAGDPGCTSASDPDEGRTIVVPTVTISALAHRYSPGDFAFPVTGISDGVDFPCGGSGGGTCSGAGFSASIQQGDVVQMRFEAPSGQRFHAWKRAGLTTEQLFVNGVWFAASDAISTFSDPVVTFESASGPAPTAVDHWAGVGNGGHVIEVLWDGTLAGDFTFTAVSFRFTVANAPPGSLFTYGPVTAYQSFSFGIGGSGPNGTPDQSVMQLEPAPPQCSNGIDDDGDGFIDYPADVGCASPTSTTESPRCNDGLDDDGDGFVDTADPGCASAADGSERNDAVECDDGIDNGDGDRLDDDGDGKIDFDGGAAANHGVALGPVDPQCTQASRNSEAPPACGFGAEILLLAPLLRRLASRRRSAVRA